MGDWRNQPRLANKSGRDIVLIVLGVFQVGFAGFVFLYLVAVIFAGAAYLGVGPLALPVLLFDLWGVVSGLRLVFRRSAGACRAAAVWHLPVGLFFFSYAIHRSEHYPAGHPEYLPPAILLLLIFAVLVVPLLPGYFPSSRRTDRSRR